MQNERGGNCSPARREAPGKLPSYGHMDPRLENP